MESGLSEDGVKVISINAADGRRLTRDADAGELLFELLLEIRGLREDLAELLGD